MKKILLAFVTLGALTFTTKAQTNLNFENWTGNEPNGWITSNSITQAGGGVQTVIKETSNPGQGSSSVKLITGSCPQCPSFSILGPFGPATPLPNPLGGTVELGSANGTGVPYSTRPISIDFKYKSKPMGNDIGAFQVELTKYNVVTGETETVGEAYFLSSVEISNWTNMNIPVVYYSSLIPDTMNIYATSSIGSIPDLSAFGVPPLPVPTPVSGSEFYIDAIVINIPSCESLALSVTGTNETSIGLNNGTAVANVSGGAQPYSYSWSNLESTQSINSLSPGMYYVTVTDNNGCQKVGNYFVAMGGCNVSVSVSGTNSSTNDVFSGNGSATATVSGGNGPYAYLWNTGGTTASISDLAIGAYAVWVSEVNNPNCGSWGYTTVWGPAGPPANLKEVSGKNNITIFPNPNNSIFSVKSEKMISKIEIHTSLGEKVYSTKVNAEKADLNLNEQATGIYFITIYSGEDKYTEKIIIQ
jgi:hypothetical protein